MLSMALINRINTSPQITLLPSFTTIYLRTLATTTSAASPPPPPPSQTEKPPSLGKLISQKYSLSRRRADFVIREGKVTLSGIVTTGPTTPVPSNAVIKLKNRPAIDLSASSSSSNKPPDPWDTTRVWIANKLAGEIVTENDPRDRPALLNRLRSITTKQHQKQKIHLKPIGRLDMNTEGLILLTNDGEYARQMELPRNEFHRTYRARVFGFLQPHKLERLRNGMTDHSKEGGGMRYKGMDVRLESVTSGGGGRKRRERAANTWLKITCVEGKNRQIRKMLELVGLRVTRLIRVAFGDYTLKNIPPGATIEVAAKPIDKQTNRGAEKLVAGRRKRFWSPKEKKRDDVARPIEWVRAHR